MGGVGSKALHDETATTRSRGATLSTVLLWGHTHPFSNSCRSNHCSGERRPPTPIQEECWGVGENITRRDARKSPSEEPYLAKSLSLGPTTTLDYKQGRLVQFCHLGLQDPLPTRRRAMIFSRRCRHQLLKLLPFFSNRVGGLLSPMVPENENSWWRDGGAVGDSDARKSSSEEPRFGKVGSFGGTTTLQHRQGGQLEFRYRSLIG